MPTVLQILNLLFVIHSRDHGHPHVTVYRGAPDDYEAFAKIRLDSIETIELKGFRPSAEKLILQIVTENRAEWLEVWNETRETK